jgi:hypothetical protein
MATIPRTPHVSSVGARLGALGWRGRLLLAVAVGAVAGFALGDPSARVERDPELARLLQGMALIKAMLVAGVLRLLWWRLGRPVALHMAWGYVAVVGSLALATLLAWQMSYFFLLSVAFHGALLSLGVLALKDDGVALPRRR